MMKSKWVSIELKIVAIENFGIKPDIIVFGKALTNGMNPLSGIWARKS